MNLNYVYEQIKELQERVAALEAKLNEPRFTYGDRVALDSGEKGVITRITRMHDGTTRYGVRIENGQYVRHSEVEAHELSYVYGY